MRPIPVLRALLLGTLLAIASLGLGTSGAAAYGKADQPLAQIEFSGNCNNDSFFLCAPPPAGFGLGGIWLWIEIDAGGSGDVAGAGCGHVKGFGGGAGPIVGDITWTGGAPQGEVFFPDPNNLYYNVTLGPGETIAFPQTVGHYSFKPAPAVTIQLQVAP
ncbi:MAG: hypothetical protein ACM3JP_02280 [Betaproteobacteria bacterium]